MARWLVCACLLLAACDGVGRALVERIPPGESDDNACEAMQCRPTGFAPLGALNPLEPAEQCTKPSPALCSQGNETEPGLNPTAAGACRHTYSLDDDAIDINTLRGLSCGSVRLVRTQPESGTIRIEEASWTNLDLEIESSSALVVEVARPFLTQAHLRITGSVVLRVLDTRSFHDVTVMSESPAAAIDFVNAEVAAVRLGDEQTKLAARLSIRRSNLDRLQIVADDLSLETVGLRHARIDAANLQWVDVTSREVQLTVGTAVISASRMSGLEVVACDVLDIHRSSLASYAIPPCSVDPTRLFQSTLSRGTLDGAFDVDDSQIRNSVFGVNAPTDLLLWDADLSSVNFCAGTDHVAIAGESSFDCALCRELDGSGVAIDACRQPDDTSLLFLKSCQLLDVAPVCFPAARRMRPPFN